MSHADNEKIKDAILRAALSDVAFEGWTKAVLESAALRAGYGAEMARAVFPSGVSDALIHFAGMADRAMLEHLRGHNPQSMRVRDRIAAAIAARLDFLDAHREAEKLAIAYWLSPLRKLQGARLVWRTADAIWNWAGDTATDYNRYTKRGLLCGVLGATMLYWAGEEDRAAVGGFIDRRIENVMSIGKATARFKKKTA
jgi:ubiquinone biosynthesis protein COQ9